MIIMDGRIPHSAVARVKPFVVCSIATKRYAPRTKKMPVQKLPRIPAATSTKERSSATRGDSTNQTSRHGSLPKAGPCRPLPKPMPMPASTVTKVQKSLPLAQVPSADRTLPRRILAPRPSKIAPRSEEGKLTNGCPGSVKTMEVTIAKVLPPPRPSSCVLRTRICRSSIGARRASEGKQDVTAKVSTTGPRNLGDVRQRPSVSIGMAKTAGRIKVTDTLAKKPPVTSGCRTGALTGNGRLTPPKAIAYPRVVEPAFHTACSPPGSPDLSSFPSQSWTIAVDVGIKQIQTPAKIFDDETFHGIGDAPKLGATGTPEGSCGYSPALSSCPTAVETPANSAEHIIGSDGAITISTPTKEPSAEVSHTVCAATITSPSENGSTSSMATLAKVMGGRQAPSSTKVSDIGNTTRVKVRSAFDIARAIFSPSRRMSHSQTETAVSKKIGTDVLRIRKLFVPPLDKDAMVSQNPTTQVEIEMLRARGKVAGGGMVDPRLDRLGSLAAMAILTKTKIGASLSSSFL